MKVFVVIRTENTDASFAKINLVHTLSDAKTLLLSLFKESIDGLEKNDVNKTVIAPDNLSAFYENKDGMLVHWGIQELEL